MSIAEVQARMAAITAQFVAPAQAMPANSGAAFAAELAKVSSSRAASPMQAAVPKGDNPASPSAETVIAEAKSYLGVPYVWGGTNPKTGLDCSGFTQLVFRKVGMDLPRVSWQQAKTGTAIDSIADARPGDLLAFSSPVDHIAIYLGDGKMINAPRPGRTVEISEVYEKPTAIRRVLPELQTTGGGVAPFAALFTQAAERTGVPARVLAAVASAESGFNPDAVSPAGARGLMQLMPGTARELGVDPMNPASAIDGAARLLAAHLRDFGSLPLALAAYNAGPGAVQRAGGIPPYPETRAYVRKVLTSIGEGS